MHQDVSLLSSLNSLHVQQKLDLYPSNSKIFIVSNRFNGFSFKIHIQIII